MLLVAPEAMLVIPTESLRHVPHYVQQHPGKLRLIQAVIPAWLRRVTAGGRDWTEAH